MKKEKISGIYRIWNTESNKCYIGASIHIYTRWNQHRSALKKDVHRNEHLQNTWNAYGDEKFNFDILERCSIELLEVCEQCWIDRYKASDREYGYNKCSIAYSLLGHKMPQHVIDAQAMNVDMIDPDGKVVSIMNVSKFCRDNKLGQSHMSSVIAGIRAHYKGWRQYSKELEEVPFDQAQFYKDRASCNIKEHLFLDKEGKKLVISNLHQYCLSNKLNEAYMRNVALGKRRYYKEYRTYSEAQLGIPFNKKDFRHFKKNLNTKFAFKNPQGELMEFVGLAPNCKKYKLNPQYMLAVHNGIARHHQHWTKYIEPTEQLTIDK